MTRRARQALRGQTLALRLHLLPRQALPLAGRFRQGRIGRR